MSNIGIFIISFFAFSLLVITAKRFKENRSVFKSLRESSYGMRMRNHEWIRNYVKKKGIDKNGLNIAKKYKNKLCDRTISESVKNKIRCTMYKEILNPLKKFMDEDEIDSYNNNEYEELRSMVGCYVLNDTMSRYHWMH